MSEEQYRSRKQATATNHAPGAEASPAEAQSPVLQALLKAIQAIRSDLREVRSELREIRTEGEYQTGRSEEIVRLVTLLTAQRHEANPLDLVESEQESTQCMQDVAAIGQSDVLQDEPPISFTEVRKEEMVPGAILLKPIRPRRRAHHGAHGEHDEAPHMGIVPRVRPSC